MNLQRFCKRALGVIATGAVAITMYSTAQAQAIPLIGTYDATGRADMATCTRLQPVTVATVAEALSNRLYLPIITGNESVPSCPNLLNGAQFFVDAETNQGELIANNLNPAEEYWSVTDISTKFIFDRSVISPTITITRWQEIMDGTGLGPNLVVGGLWDGMSFAGGDGDMPANWKIYKDAERALRLERRGIQSIKIDALTKLGMFEYYGTGTRLGILCPAAIGQQFTAQWIATLPTPLGVTVMVEHPWNELPSVCPHLRNYHYVQLDDLWRLLPAQERQSIDEEIERESVEWKRSVWVLPNRDTLQPQVANATFTATALGGGAIVYMAIRGVVSGNAMVMFTPLP